MKNFKIWTELKNYLDSQVPSILVIVIESKGSSPGRQGFKLLVAGENLIGTIGGGIMEANIIELAKQMIHESQKQPLMKELLHYRNALPEKRSGLICSGSQRVILIPFYQSDVSTINKIIQSYSSNEVTSIVIDHKGFKLSNDVDPFSLQVIGETEFRYTERVGYPHSVYIFGAGHVGSAISNVLSMLDFRIILVDNRHELPNLSRTYHELHQIPYSEASNIVQDEERSYVLVVTSEKDNDQIVLESLRNKSFKFLGLMGSKTKIKTIFEYLRKQGIMDEFISQIYAPLGIGIPNQTPEEIGISVAAQLIDKRYSRPK